MTLLPLQDPRIRGVDGPRYKVGPYCEVPGCHRPVDHVHHLWRRSFLTGDFWWVEVPGIDGMTIIGNVVGICWQHHDDVTGNIGGHRAAFVYRGGALYWATWIGEAPEDLGLLLRYQDAIRPRPFEGELPAPVTEQERCDKCGRRLPHAKPEGTPRRKRRRKVRFQFLVPQDTEEDGWQLVRETFDEMAAMFGRTESEEYFTFMDMAQVVRLNYDPAEV